VNQQTCFSILCSINDRVGLCLRAFLAHKHKRNTSHEFIFGNRVNGMRAANQIKKAFYHHNIIVIVVSVVVSWVIPTVPEYSQV
jgi:hypothetical protein